MSPFSTEYFNGDQSLWLVGRRACLLLPAALVFLSKGEGSAALPESKCLSWWFNLLGDGAGLPLVIVRASYLFWGRNEITWTAFSY